VRDLDALVRRIDPAQPQHIGEVVFGMVPVAHHEDRL